MSVRPLLIILDRDGVINQESTDYIKSPEEFFPIAGSLEAILRLQRQGHTVTVATNQSGVARAYFSLDTLHAIHDKLNHMLISLGGEPLNIFYCPHHPDLRCGCRKPEVGLLESIISTFPQWADHKEKVFFVGDALRDLEAALRFDIQPLLVLSGKGLKTLREISVLKQEDPLTYARYAHTRIYNNLSDLVDHFLHNQPAANPALVSSIDPL